MTAAKSGQPVPHQYRTPPAVSVASPERVAPAKAHPWRAFNPGWLKSDDNRAQKVIPTHARPLR